TPLFPYTTLFRSHPRDADEVHRSSFSIRILPPSAAWGRLPSDSGIIRPDEDIQPAPDLRAGGRHPIKPGLRGQPLDLPCNALCSAVHDPVMQPIPAALPEFDVIRLEQESAPIRRTWDVALGILLRGPGHGILQYLPAFDDAALRRDQCAQLAASWPRGEVLLRYAAG